MKRKKYFEYIERGTDSFIDHRGEINNFKLKEKINLIATITSKKNTMRSNHYHPVQQQKCLLIEGQYISVYKDLVDKKAIKITHLVNPGDLVITEPNVAHTMIFTKETKFLNLVKGEREHKNYGKTHTIPFELVSNEEKGYLFKNYKSECRICENENFIRFVSLGFQPLSNNLIKSEKDDKKFYPLEVNVCKNCFNAQLSIKPDFKKIYSNYLYKSSISKKFIDHFDKAALKYIKLFKLKPRKSFIIDIGSNDGIGLIPFKKKGFKNILGYEPSIKLCKESRRLGIKTINKFFDKKNTKALRNKADLVLASNVFAHNDNLEEMLECIKNSLKFNGTIVIEIQYLINTIKDVSFDNIYHEHVNYWSLTSIKNFFNRFNCRIFRVEKLDTHGGSLRIYASKNKKNKIDNSVNSILKSEIKFGIKNAKTYENYQKKLDLKKINVIKNISWLKKKYKILIGYGASAKATVSLNYFGINKKQIKNMIDDNKFKKGKIIPGTGIKIISKNKIKKKSKCIIVFAWNMFEEIKKNNNDLSNIFINIRDLYSSQFKKKFLKKN